MPFEMVDAVLAETGAQQHRIRLLPSRVVVYLLLAAGLFTEIDGTILCCPDTTANLATFSKGGSSHGTTTGFPMVRLLTLMACGTRTIIDAAFGTDRTGELGYAGQLLRSARAGMIVLADRNFAAAAWLQTLAATGADMLVRVKNGRRMPVCATLPDGTILSRIGRVEVRVITAQVTITTSEGRRSEVYRLVTSVLDPTVPAVELVELYHQRWEIETAFAELKSTSLGGRVLRSRTPTGVAQELYALLITYQALRIAVSDATLSRPDLDPDRASFAIARQAARDQLIRAAGIIADTVVDLVGVIGRHVLARPLPARRIRTNPRVVKRAISKYVASTAKGRHREPSRPAAQPRSTFR